MGLFNTGDELLQQRRQQMVANNRTLAAQAQNTARGKINAQMGADLASMVVGAFMDKPGGVTAGDIEANLPEDVDLQTSDGLIQFQRQLFDAGDNESALALDKHIKDRLSIEGSRSKASADKADASKIIAPNNNELNAVHSVLGSRATDFGENLASLRDSDDPFKVSQYENLVSGIATTEKTISAKLNDMGKSVNPHLIRTALADAMEASNAVSDDSWFGGMFGAEGVIDIDAQNAALKQFEGEVFAQFKDLKPGSEPVKTEPGTTSTGQQELSPVPGQDVQGAIEPEGVRDPGTKIENPTFETAIAPVNDQIQMLNKSLKGVKRGTPAYKEIQRLKALEMEKVNNIKQAFGLSVR